MFGFFFILLSKPNLHECVHIPTVSEWEGGHRYNKFMTHFHSHTQYTYKIEILSLFSLFFSIFCYSFSIK